MALIVPSPTGGKITYAAASGGGDHFVAGSGRLHVKNASVAPITVTVVGQKKCDQGVAHNKTFVVPNADDFLCAPLPDQYTDADGFVQLTYSGVVTLTVAVIA